MGKKKNSTYEDGQKCTSLVDLLNVVGNSNLSGSAVDKSYASQGSRHLGAEDHKKYEDHHYHSVEPESNATFK